MRIPVFTAYGRIGRFIMGLPFHLIFPFQEICSCEFLVTIFDIYVFTQVQTMVKMHYLSL